MGSEQKSVEAASDNTDRADGVVPRLMVFPDRPDCLVVYLPRCVTLKLPPLASPLSKASLAAALSEAGVDARVSEGTPVLVIVGIGGMLASSPPPWPRAIPGDTGSILRSSSCATAGCCWTDGSRLRIATGVTILSIRWTMSAGIASFVSAPAFR